MAGQSARLTLSEVAATIKKLESNDQTRGNDAHSGKETNQQVKAVNRPQKREA